MKKLTIFYFLFMLIFSCENQEERPYCPQNPNEWDSKNINHFLNDSIQIGEKVKSFPTVDMDSVYRFRGKGGWGEFDYLCSVYNSDDSYFLELVHDDFIDQKHKKNIIKTTTPITKDQWDDFVYSIDTLDFWCLKYDMHKVFGITSIDADQYFTIAKQKDDMRVVKWNFVSPTAKKHPEYSKQKNTVTDFHTLITKGLRIGNYPQSKGSVFFKRDKDSLHTEAVFFHAPFAGNYGIQYKGNDIMDRNGFSKMTIHKSDSNSLNDIKFIEKLYDGTTRTFYPHEIKESKSK